MVANFWLMINNKLQSFELDDIGCFRRFQLNDCNIEAPGCIYAISITENLFIIMHCDPKFGGDKISFRTNVGSPDLIKAYDWNGNFLWSIDDIIKDINVPIYGGNLFSVDMLKSECPEINIDESHLFFNVCTDGKRYVVDLTDKKVLYTKPAK